MKVLVLSELTDAVYTKMKQDLGIDVLNFSGKPLGDGNALLHLLQKYDPDIVVISAHPFTVETFSAAKSLKMIICTRGNPVNIDLEEADKNDIIVTNTPARNANAVAEFTIGLMISLMRKIPFAYQDLRNGKYLLDADTPIDWEKKDVVWLHGDIQPPPYLVFRGSELFGKTLGLVAAGAIGRLLAQKAKALGLNIIAYDPYMDKESLAAFGIEKVDFDELLASADIISLHAKVTNATKSMISHKQFELMKKTAILINTARGALIDQEALYVALSKNKILGAALDVFTYEPLLKNDPLLALSNLLITPHLGGASKDVIMHHSRMAYESLEDFIKGNDVVRFRCGISKGG
jgi:D-3-phosphoglycerate dehydrogenase / 2-oxoglutarate reductase